MLTPTNSSSTTYMLPPPHWWSQFWILSLGLAQRASTPTLSTDLGLNPKNYKKMPHLGNWAHLAFHLHSCLRLLSIIFQTLLFHPNYLFVFVLIKVWLNKNDMLTTPVFFVILFILFWLVRWLGRVQVTIINTPRGSKLSPTVRGPPSLGSCDSSDKFRNDPS